MHFGGSLGPFPVGEVVPLEEVRQLLLFVYPAAPEPDAEEQVEAALSVAIGRDRLRSCWFQGFSPTHLTAFAEDVERRVNGLLARLGSLHRLEPLEGIATTAAEVQSVAHTRDESRRPNWFLELERRCIARLQLKSENRWFHLAWHGVGLAGLIGVAVPTIQRVGPWWGLVAFFYGIALGGMIFHPLANDANAPSEAPS
jgi:hypothetical protein